MDQKIDRSMVVGAPVSRSRESVYREPQYPNLRCVTARRKAIQLEDRSLYFFPVPSYLYISNCAYLRHPRYPAMSQQSTAPFPSVGMASLPTRTPNLLPLSFSWLGVVRIGRPVLFHSHLPSLGSVLTGAAVPCGYSTSNFLSHARKTPLCGCSVSTISSSMHLSFAIPPWKHTKQKTNVLFFPRRKHKKVPPASSPRCFPVKPNCAGRANSPSPIPLFGRGARKQSDSNRTAKRSGHEAEAVRRRLVDQDKEAAGKTDWKDAQRRKVAGQEKEQEDTKEVEKEVLREIFSLFFSFTQFAGRKTVACMRGHSM